MIFYFSTIMILVSVKRIALILVSNQVPEVDTAVRSLTVMWDGSLVVAANNKGTCYVWRLLRGTQVPFSVSECPFLVIMR